MPVAPSSPCVPPTIGVANPIIGKEALRGEAVGGGGGAASSGVAASSGGGGSGGGGQTWCDLCGSHLPRVRDEESIFYDCYVHPYWREKQILCPSCACNDGGAECCITCEFKISIEDIPISKFTSEGYMCHHCSISAAVLQFKEAYIIKQHLIQRMVTLFNLSQDIKTALSRLPVRLKSKTRHLLTNILTNHMDCDSWNEFRTLFGYCSFERYDPERVLLKEIVILKGLPRIIFSKVLSHELFHALMSIQKGIILNFLPAQRSIYKLASEGHYREFCTTPQQYRQLEEAVCHLFAGQLLANSKVYSDHEQRLKDLWLYKTLPITDTRHGDLMNNHPPLSSAALPLWNYLCELCVPTAARLPSNATIKAETRSIIWTRLIQELAALKCVWDI